VSGIHLVELAASQHGLSYSLGFGKQAICQLDSVGPSGGDCWAEYPEFWGYWHGNGSDGWTWASGGAATYRVGDGDVEGWVWGTGDNGTSHRAPPATHADDVCPPPPPPEPSPSRDPEPPTSGGDDRNGGGTTAGGTQTPSAEPSASAASGKERERDDRGDDRDRDRPTPSVTPTPTPAPTATPDDDASDLRATGTTLPQDGGGPPAGLLVAVALGLALAGVAWRRTRRAPTGAPS